MPLFLPSCCLVLFCFVVYKHNSGFQARPSPSLARLINVNTRQHYKAILNLTDNTNMKVLNVNVTNVNIRQHDRTSLRLTNNINMKVLNVHVTNVNIREQHRDFLRLTNNLNMKVLNIHVPNVNIRPIETFPHSLHITQSRLCFDNKCLIK